MRNSSTSIGFTSCPSACTTFIRSPGMRVSNRVIAEPLMKRNRTFSPSLNSPVQLSVGPRPFTRNV